MYTDAQLSSALSGTPTGGGGGSAATSRSNTEIADIRDVLSAIVGRGSLSLSDKETRADYQQLIKLIGGPAANKLVTQALIHNNRSAKEPLEKRVQSFYDIGSNDPEVASVLKSVKAFGYGVLPGLREQGREVLQELSGRYIPPANGTINPQLQNMTPALR